MFTCSAVPPAVSPLALDVRPVGVGLRRAPEDVVVVPRGARRVARILRMESLFDYICFTFGEIVKCVHLVMEREDAVLVVRGAAFAYRGK